MEKIKKKQNNGITLIALVLTVIVLIILASISIGTLGGKKGLIKQAEFAEFGSRIREYQKQIEEYIVQKEMIEDTNEEIKINALTKEEIKEIIPSISEEDAEKYVIQNNELRYRTDKVEEKEVGWLTELGIAAMGVMFAITFMNKDKIYKTIYSDKIEFPLITPTNSAGNFAGWYYDEATTNEAIEGDSVSSNITLYAKYEAVQTEYVATFMANGSVYETIKGNTLMFPETDPTKDTVKFTGWYYDEGCTKVATVGDSLTKNTTLYPGWTSYITNKLEGTLMFIETYPNCPNFGDGVWHYITNKSELSNIKPVDSYTVPSYYPAYVKYRDYEVVEGEVLYTYKGSTPIAKTEITSWTSDGTIEFTSYQVLGYSTGEIKLAGDRITDLGRNPIAKIKITFQDGTIDTDEFRVYIHRTCLAKGTKITLADHTTKNIEDIEYEDDLLVWDFDNGKFATAKPLWIKKAQVAEEYNCVKLEDGTELKTVADHRIFNMESQKFTYTMNEEDTPIGTTVFKEDGTVTRLVERKVVKEQVEYYNIITNYHMNLFANGLLTSLRLNNLYKIQDMKFIKDNRSLATKEEFKNIPEKYFNGLRLAEQPKEINNGNDVKHTKTLEEYVQRLLPIAKERK